MLINIELKIHSASSAGCIFQATALNMGKKKIFAYTNDEKLYCLYKSTDITGSLWAYKQIKKILNGRKNNIREEIQHNQSLQ